jgi:hypothetical protein
MHTGYARWSMSGVRSQISLNVSLKFTNAIDIVGDIEE